MKKWTKAEALQKFIDDRVLGDAPFGYDLASRSCEYRHSAGGGCAIGCLLPEDVAARLPGKAIFDVVSDDPELLAQYLDDVDAEFWDHLQMAHDYLALVVNGRDAYNISSRFEEHLRLAADLA